MTRPCAIEATGSLAGVPGASRFRRDLSRLAKVVARRFRRGIDVSVRVVSDSEIRRLHRRWLGVGRATDVISWPLSGPKAPVLSGALSVSRDTARREAARRGHSAYHELVLYVVHGVLHLAGHDDHAAEDRIRMRKAERALLASLGLPSVFDSKPGPARPRRRGARKARAGRKARGMEAP